MKRFIKYCTILVAGLFASCVNVTEGLDEMEALAVSADKFELTSAGDEKEITIESHCPWEIVSSENWSWITPSLKKGNKGKEIVKFIISENTSVSDRTAVITVANETYGLSRDIAILQRAGAPFIVLSKDKFDVTADGISETIVVNSNVDYSVSSSAEWCKISAVKGVAGSNTLDVVILPSPITQRRTATITFSNAECNFSSTVEVVQNLLTPVLDVSSTMIDATDLGLEKTLAVVSNISWVLSCDANWVTLSHANGNGSADVCVTVQKNPSVEAREAKIFLSNSEYEIVKEILVNQLPIVPSLAISEEEISATQMETTKEITVLSNVPWTAVCESEWVNVTPSNGQGGTTSLKVTIASNATTSAREAKVVVSNAEYGLTKEIALSQSAFEPELNVSESQISVSVEGATKEIAVISNISWTASCDSEWVNLTPVNGASGERVLKVTMDENTTTSSRAAIIHIKNTQYNLAKTISVTQEAFSPLLNVTSTSLSLSAGGESKSVSVTSNITWEASCSSSWITLSPVNGQSGTRALVVTAASNTGSSRSATVKVKNSKYNITRNIIVNQVAFVPVLDFDNGSSVSLDYTSGKTFVKINSNVQYLASTTADWLTVEKTDNGVNLIYTSNQTSTSSRTAKVVITARDNADLRIELSVTQQGFSTNNVIRYTSSSAALPSVSTGFGANIIGMSSENGVCELRFDGPITAIPSSAFKSCTQLTGITIPSTVTSIGSDAFNGCTGLKSVTMVGNNVQTIGSNAFRGCTSLTGITLSSSMTSIDQYVFYNCQSLKDVTLPSSLNTVGQYAFYGCTSLTDLEIPQSVTTIGNYAFNQCEGLKELDIKGSSISIGSYAFGQCTNLTDVTVEGTMSSLGSYAFNQCSKLRTVQLAEGITSIGERVFYKCSSLKDINIPSTVTTIGNYAFYYCSALDEITLPSALTSIYSYAFEYCTSLEFVNIPSKVTSIGTYAFAYCSSLQNVLCMSKTPPTGASNMFYNNASGRKIYVPVGKSSTYKSASYWSSYSSYIYEVDYTPTECTSLTISAENVAWDATTTMITYTAITNGSSNFGPVTGVDITGQVQSGSFAKNTSYSDVTRTISWTYLGKTAKTTITQGAKPKATYSVVLNSQWRKSTSVSNPDTSTYDGVYESYSNYNVNSKSAVMYIDIQGYSTFTIYIRSDAETTYDYVKVSELDSTSIKTSTSGSQSSSTSISAYKAVVYSNIPSGSHRITITYTKDSSVNKGSDRGYILIPKNQ